MIWHSNWNYSSQPSRSPLLTTNLVLSGELFHFILFRYHRWQSTLKKKRRWLLILISYSKQKVGFRTSVETESTEWPVPYREVPSVDSSLINLSIRKGNHNWITERGTTIDTEYCTTETWYQARASREEDREQRNRNCPEWHYSGMPCHHINNLSLPKIYCFIHYRSSNNSCTFLVNSPLMLSISLFLVVTSALVKSGKEEVVVVLVSSPQLGKRS